MPSFDMSQEALQNYMGCSPRGSDFDDFWRAIQNSASTTPPPFTLAKGPIQVPGTEAYDLTFTTLDGALIYTKYIKPQGEGPFPTLFCFHGYHGNSGDWFDKIALAHMGFCIFAMDSRGQGGRSTEPGTTRGTTLTGHIIKGWLEGPHNLVFTKIYTDTIQLVTLAKSFSAVRHSSLHTMGASQGGALAIACGALNPEIRSIFACYPFLIDFKRVLEIPHLMGAYSEINNYFKFSDPLHKNEKTVFNTLSYIDLQNFAPRMSADLHMFTGLMDEVCPPSTQYAFYNKYQGVKTITIYPQHGHEWLPGFMDTVLAQLIRDKVNEPSPA